jgi:hypothetical protein
MFSRLFTIQRMGYSPPKFVLEPWHSLFKVNVPIICCAFTDHITLLCGELLEQTCRSSFQEGLIALIGVIGAIGNNPFCAWRCRIGGCIGCIGVVSGLSG